MRLVLFHVEIPVLLVIKLDHKSMRKAVLDDSQISSQKKKKLRDQTHATHTWSPSGLLSRPPDADLIYGFWLVGWIALSLRLRKLSQTYREKNYFSFSLIQKMKATTGVGIWKWWWCIVQYPADGFFISPGLEFELNDVDQWHCFWNLSSTRKKKSRGKRFVSIQSRISMKGSWQNTRSSGRTRVSIEAADLAATYINWYRSAVIAGEPYSRSRLPLPLPYTYLTIRYTTVNEIIFHARLIFAVSLCISIIIMWAKKTRNNIDIFNGRVKRYQDKYFAKVRTLGNITC